MSKGMTTTSSGVRFSALGWLTRPRVLGRFLFGLICLVTLIGLFYLMENWRGNRAWAQSRKQIEARGMSLDWEMYVPPPAEDDQNFAQAGFFQPLFDFHPGTQQWRDTNAFYQVRDFAKEFDLDQGLGRWMLAQRTDFNVWLAAYDEQATASEPAGQARGTNAAIEVLALLQACDPVVRELQQASRRPQARFPLSYDEENLFGIVLPHLQVVKRLGRVLQLRALAELELGRSEDAFEDLRLIGALGETLEHEPILISQLVRLVLHRLGTSVFWEGLVDRKWSRSNSCRWKPSYETVSFLPPSGGACLLNTQLDTG